MAKAKHSKLEKEILEAAAKAGEAGFFADLEIVMPLVEAGLGVWFVLFLIANGISAITGKDTFVGVIGFK